MRDQLDRRHKRLVWVDGAFAFLMALVSVVLGNTGFLPVGEWHRYLEIRITVLDAAFAGLFVLLWGYCFESLGLYRSERGGVLRTLSRILIGCGLMTVVLSGYLEVTRTTGPTMQIAVLFFLCSVANECLRVFGSQHIGAGDPQLVVILGTGLRAEKAWREIRTRYNGTVKVIGFVDDRSVADMPPEIAKLYLGTTDNLSELLLRNVVDELLIAVPVKSCYDMGQRAIETAEAVGVRAVWMQDVYISTLKQSAFASPELFRELVPFHQDYLSGQAIKRVVDVLLAALGLCALAPVFVLVALAVKLTSPGPVFFSQSRFGHRRRLFKMYKFRSMLHNAPELMAQLEAQNEAHGPIFKIRHDPRITPLGRLLRASSLDELPQLWNVLIGNMSLVGPRPMSVRDVSHFSEATLMRRFTVKPGITGLWQVSGRSTLSFEKWIEMDFNYIDNWSLALDFHILARTLGVVLKGTGAV